MQATTETYTLQHYRDLWDESFAAGLDPVDRLIYRSNLLGSDWRITNTGGGNTSGKIMGTDPISGEPVEVLWVKGSGGDLRTATRANFASLYQARLLSLQDIYARLPERGPKSPAEDAMVAMYAQATFNLNRCAPSIDTPLHSFIPYKHVDHMHPVACIAIATAKDEAANPPDLRRGDLDGLAAPRLRLGHNPADLRSTWAKGVMLGGHGLINWADSVAVLPKTLRLTDQARATWRSTSLASARLAARATPHCRRGSVAACWCRCCPGCAAG
jgi:rhamnose utilization protein RhaD (predicted bifunctional aldolase and dehydrogenase)